MRRPVVLVEILVQINLPFACRSRSALHKFGLFTGKVTSGTCISTTNSHSELSICEFYTILNVHFEIPSSFSRQGVFPAAKTPLLTILKPCGSSVTLRLKDCTCH